MQIKDLLLLLSGEPAKQVQRYLAKKGISSTILEPSLANPATIDQFRTHVCNHRFIASLQQGKISFINNVDFQLSAEWAPHLYTHVPDMWVQFGYNGPALVESGVDAGQIAQRLAQELYSRDYRLISQ